MFTFSYIICDLSLAYAHFKSESWVITINQSVAEVLGINVCYAI